MNKELDRHYIVYIIIVFIVIAGISAIAYHEREKRISDFMKFIETETSLPQLEQMLKKDPGLAAARAKEGYTALDQAIAHDELEFARILVSRGADVDARDKYGITPMHMASYYRKERMIEFLISKGADVNIADQEGHTALHVIITYSFGNESELPAETGKCLELLISRGADINARDSKGESPLSRALRMKRTGIAELLRKHGARQ